MNADITARAQAYKDDPSNDTAGPLTDLMLALDEGPAFDAQNTALMEFLGADLYDEWMDRPFDDGTGGKSSPVDEITRQKAALLAMVAGKIEVDGLEDGGTTVNIRSTCKICGEPIAEHHFGVDGDAAAVKAAVVTQAGTEAGEAVQQHMLTRHAERLDAGAPVDAAERAEQIERTIGTISRVLVEAALAPDRVDAIVFGFAHKGSDDLQVTYAGAFDTLHQLRGALDISLAKGDFRDVVTGHPPITIEDNDDDIP